MLQRMLSFTCFCILAIGTFSGTAFAIPIAGNYTLSSTILNGTFTSDGNMLTAWSFTTTPASVNFTGLPPNPSNLTANTPIIFGQQTPVVIIPSIGIFWNGTALSGIQARFINDTVGQIDAPATASPASIPEPSTSLLLSAALLGLAGSRWYQRRREGTQVG